MQRCGVGEATLEGDRVDHPGCERNGKGTIMAQARTGDHVRIHFTGRLDDGTVFASSADAEPMEFTLGTDEVLPAIEDAVAGMEPGETKTVYIPSDEAFGPWREDLVEKVPRESLPDSLDLEIGQQLWVDQPGIEPVIVSVIDVSEATVTLDANHPLAGQDLVFDLELVDLS
jgi:peptidylprolyl isomerase